MNNVKLASCTAATVAADTVAPNGGRRKLVITNPNGSAGTFSLGGTSSATTSGDIAIAANDTIVLDEYKGAARTSGNVKLVELT